MGKRTDPARIVTWIQSRLPDQFDPKTLADVVSSSLEEIINNNLSYGRQPITFDSVRRIVDFFRNYTMREVADEFKEKGFPIDRQTLDEIKKLFDNVKDELRKNYYEG